MRVIERYVLWRLSIAFVGTTASLAGVVWTTQALRQFNLVTVKGQTLWVFLEITLLALPLLLLLIMPFALAIAMVVVLNQMNGDSELVVINATGAPPSALLRPFVILAVAVSLIAAALSTVIAPAGMRLLRTELTLVRADLVANIIKPGRFIEIEDGLTFHIRDRLGDGSLKGLLLDDRREANEAFTYLAERGQILEAFGRTVIVMNDGTIQRRTADGDLSVVEFEAYGFDLTNLTAQDRDPVYKASERPLSELIAPDESDAYVAKNIGRMRSDLHDRLSQPFYPIAFALIAFLFLGEARTTRQSRGVGIAVVLTVCLLVRLLGFFCTNLVVRSPLAVPFPYLVPITAAAIAYVFIATETRPSMPRAVTRLGDRLYDLTSRAARRFTPSTSARG